MNALAPYGCRLIRPPPALAAGATEGATTIHRWTEGPTTLVSIVGGEAGLCCREPGGRLSARMDG